MVGTHLKNTKTVETSQFGGNTGKLGRVPDRQMSESGKNGMSVDPLEASLREALAPLHVAPQLGAL